MNRKGFTLVELIVVITIISILWTISFVSFQNYSNDARDSKTIADISNTYKKIALFKISSGFVPQPDESIHVFSEVGKAISFQWEVWKNAKSILDIWYKLESPKGNNYQYSTNGTLTQYNLVWKLNTARSSLINTSYANQEEYLYFKWDDIISVFDENQKYISENLNDIKNPNAQVFLGTKIQDTIENSGKISIQNIPEPIKENYAERHRNCKEILDTEKSSWNKIYTIYPSGKSTEAYCDMTTDGGGWTVIMSDWNSPLSETIYNSWLTPTPNSKWLINYFVDNKINDVFSEMRVASISQPSTNFVTYQIQEDWIWDFTLNQAYHGYLYSKDVGFTWGELWTHKCNFSIIVKNNYWCTDYSIPYSYPINGREIWAFWAAPTASYWSIKHTWQFKNGTRSYRIWWTTPTGYSNYYDGRLPAYLMIR